MLDILYIMKKNKKIVPFYYQTGEYLMISESESSHILNNMGFSAHWKAESVMAEIIVSQQKFPAVQGAIVYVFMLKEHTKKLLVLVCKKYA